MVSWRGLLLEGLFWVLAMAAVLAHAVLPEEKV